MPVTVCRCHGLPLRKSHTRWYCPIKLKARWRLGSRRYRKTAKYKALEAVYNDRRIYVGSETYGRANTVAQATLIRAHIRSKRIAFNARQSRRAETESLSAR